MKLDAVCAALEQGGLAPLEAATLAFVRRAVRRGLLPAAAGDDAFCLRHLQAARVGVADRLLDALVRERLVDGRREPADADAGGVVRTHIPLADGSRLVVESENPGPFGRLGRVARRSHVAPAGRVVAIDHPLLLLAAVRPLLAGTFEPARIDRLAEELDGSVANLALALGAEALGRERWRRAAVQTLDAWERALGTADHRRRALEASVWEGHTVHPCTRTRHGLSPAASIRAAPELSEAPISLGFVAVRRELLQTAGAAFEPVLAALWPDLEPTAQAQLAARGVDADHYAVVPVHPWQLRHKLPTVFADLYAEAGVVPLQLRKDTWPQLSLRTVEPVAAGPAPWHLKLAIGVQTTSAERTISPQSVHNGPLLTALLQRLVAEAKLPLRIVGEVASVGLEPSRIPDGEGRARHLAAIVRENPTLQAPGSGANWLGAALASRTPFDPRSFAAVWIDAVAARRGLPPAEAARLFFERACAALLVPALALLSRYGVALEAHGQNAFFDLDDDGLPCGLAVRDFGGLRLYRPRLAAAGHELALRPGSAPDAPDLDEVRAKTSHCVLQSHLADLIAAIERDLPGALGNPWRLVRTVLERELAHDPETLAALLASPTRAKSLTTMRLTDRYNRYLYTEVPNPLAGA